MKKIVSLLLVVVLALGMASMTSAAAVKYTTVTDNMLTSGFNSANSKTADSLGDVAAGEVFSIPLFGNYLGGAPVAVTKSDVNESKIVPRVNWVTGSNTIFTIALKYDKAFSFWLPGTKTAYIKVEFEDPFVSTASKDFEAMIYLQLDGTRFDTNAQGVTISGTFKNRTTLADEDMLEVDSSQGQIIEADEYIPKISLSLSADDDIFADIRMTDGKKIYARAYIGEEEKDFSIIDKYNSIEKVYTIRQVGLSSYTGNFMRLEDAGASNYVYTKTADGSLKLLGRGGEKLPFAEKYYISTAKLELEEEVEGPVDVPAPTTTPSANVNPSTGL